MIEPGATLGFFGGGQLGRMAAMAARSLGYHIIALDPDASCASRFVVDRCITASFDDLDAAEKLARETAVTTIEIEKISLASLERAAQFGPVRPNAEVLRIVQNRATQKNWLAQNLFPVAPFVVLEANADAAAAATWLGDTAGILKTTRDGYDGRGQESAKNGADVPRAHAVLGRTQVVLEKRLALKAELSVLVARRPSGETVVYPPALNHHEAGILHWSVMPAPLPMKILDQATLMARDIAKTLNVYGILVVEFFLTHDDEVLVNELAPRPHNTFHTTEVACPTSQFEQLIRAVCDLPLGAVDIIKPAAIVNLLGDLWLDGKRPNYDRAMALPGVRVHLYGKRNAFAGRKMGHLSALGASPEEAVHRVQQAEAALKAAI